VRGTCTATKAGQNVKATFTYQVIVTSFNFAEYVAALVQSAVGQCKLNFVEQLYWLLLDAVGRASVIYLNQPKLAFVSMYMALIFFNFFW